MATLEQLRTGLINNILAIKNKELLIYLSNYVDFRKKPAEIVKLSKYQKLMLVMSIEDVKNGRVYSEEEVEKMDKEWLN